MIADQAAQTRARAAARFAAGRNLPATVCPYQPGSADVGERQLALVWVRAYLAALPGPPPVDYTG